MSKLIISENERKNILSLYNLIQEDLTPLQKLMQCKFTPDGKYVVYEGKAYNTTNGEEVPINEGWTLSDILHTGADVLSMGLDFVFPGTGAVVDILNGLSYVIEAQFKSADQKDSLYLMAAITFAFVLLPGPLQAMAAPLRKAVSTGKGFNSPVVVKALKIIGGSLDTILLGLPTKINAALKSPLAKNILGKYSNKISGFFDAFKTRIKSILGKLTGKAGKEGTEIAGKLGGSSVDDAIKLLPVSVGAVSKELLPAIVSKSASLSKLSINLGNNGAVVISKLGFVPKKSYRFGKKTFTIPDNIGEYISFEEVAETGVKVVKKMKVWDFIKKYILVPSGRLNTVAVPVITKATLRIFNDGTLNTKELSSMKPIDSNQTQKDLIQLSALVAEYEGDTRKYTVNNNAKMVQKSLMSLGYPLPRFKDDGKFGPETMKSLKKFQQDNGLTSSIGKMDRATAKKLAELLKSKNIAGSEQLQKSLNSI